MNPVHVIGTEIGSYEMPAAYADIISQAEVIVGGAGPLERWSGLCPRARRVDLGGAQGVALHAALDTVFSGWQNGLRVAILADGDPLYFGIGATLLRKLPPDTLRILPGISTVQTACSRLNISWTNVNSLSLHGRDDWRPLAQAVRWGRPVCVLGDAAHGPSEVASWLLERGADWLRLHLFTGLNTQRERHLDLDLRQAASMKSFTVNPEGSEANGPSPTDREELNAPSMLLVPGGSQSRVPVRSPSLDLTPPLPQTDGGLFTKGPVRAAALAALNIHPHDTIWDIGAGSGSVALGAAALAWNGWVCAVERNPRRIAMLQENRRHFAALNMDIIEAYAPNGLNAIPDPDGVFVGGGLSDTRRATDMLDAIMARLRPGGRMVATCALLGSLERLRAYARNAGIAPGITSFQACEAVPLADDMHFEAHNPIFLVILEKPRP